MSEIKDGRPAFPSPEWSDAHGNVVPAEYGMSLRDYFAAKAMQALVGAEFRQEFTTEEDASYAYKMADAMLKAREQ